MYKYITVEKIQRRLGRRANVFSNSLIPSDNVSVLSSNLDTELIHDLIIRNEALIDTYFGMLYVLPIDPRDIPLIEPILEGFVINDLMMSLYDQGMIASLGGDGGFGSTIYQKAKELLKGYFTGSGIYIPGIFAPEDNAMREAYPLLLPFTLQLTERRDNITRSYTVIGKYQNNRSNMEFDFTTDNKSYIGTERQLW